MSHSGASEKASKGSGCCSFLTLQGVGAQGSTDSQGKASETALSQLRIISLDVTPLFSCSLAGPGTLYCQCLVAIRAFGGKVLGPWRNKEEAEEHLGKVVWNVK